MGFEAVSDAGPLLHLHEISASRAIAILKTCTTQEVAEEIKKYTVPLQIPVQKIDHDKTAFFHLKHSIDLGEASCIALCLHNRIGVLLTDDLGARSAAKTEGLEVHGSIGILLRAYRDGILSREQTLQALKNIKTKSTLFITHTLVQDAIDAVKRFKK